MFCRHSKLQIIQYEDDDDSSSQSSRASSNLAASSLMNIVPKINEQNSDLENRYLPFAISEQKKDNIGYLACLAVCIFLFILIAMMFGVSYLMFIENPENANISYI